MGATSSKTKLPPLMPVSSCETRKFMGHWFVHGVKPTYLETTCSNAVEYYTLVEGKKFDINVDFNFNTGEALTSPLRSLPQKAWVQGENRENSGLWKISPLPLIKMPYLILEVDEQCAEYAVIGYPSRAYAWIMGRKPVMDDETYQMLTKRLEDKHRYDLTGLRRVPQVWTAEERDKRGMKEVIPDDYLVKSTGDGSSQG